MPFRLLSPHLILSGWWDGEICELIVHGVTRSGEEETKLSSQVVYLPDPPWLCGGCSIEVEV